MITEQPNKCLNVLIADDDQDDWYFAELAFKEAGLDHAVRFVKDGEELMDYLSQKYASDPNALPDLILLDLNMPKKDGRVALQEIRADIRFEKLNVVIFSTCISDEDKVFTAMFGVTRHVTKPFEFSELVQTIKEICDSVVVA
jgi:two-component system, response regulator